MARFKAIKIPNPLNVKLIDCYLKQQYVCTYSAYINTACPAESTEKLAPYRNRATSRRSENNAKM